MFQVSCVDNSIKGPGGHEAVVEIAIKCFVCHLSGHETTKDQLEKITMKSLEMGMPRIQGLVSVAASSQTTQSE